MQTNIFLILLRNSENVYNVRHLHEALKRVQAENLTNFWEFSWSFSEYEYKVEHGTQHIMRIKQ